MKSDDDVVLAINRFDHWIKKQNLNYADAVSQMLHFMRNGIQQGMQIRDALNDRLGILIDEMIEDAEKVDSRILYAVRYVAEKYRTDIFHASTEPEFIYMGRLIGATDWIFGDGKYAIGVVAVYNTIFNEAFSNKVSYAFSLSNGLDISEREGNSGRELFDVAVMKNYYNISYHNDNMSGRMAWAEGEDIALGIYKFIQSPESRGLLCSLLPPAGLLEVDWSKQQWVFEARNRQWLNYKHPRDLISYFDQMAATS
ncbi:hypothetical protein JJJ17_10310 [Paracoccus caeni]|uniref:Uncharacterized protein n=1 Tax=Paracoccus caeni TaxID=657651 RepID=A0A934VUY2_9RHOB|nr:hypothetical protein [Paracoccus caeni]MBK4216316.1 hypothetical protein [Paracoccus caeni]